MPERSARTEAFNQVTEITGSGPARFESDERVVVARAVHTRFEHCHPREDGEVSGTAGPKVVHPNRVDCFVQPDAGTAVNALIAGERLDHNPAELSIFWTMKRS